MTRDDLLNRVRAILLRAYLDGKRDEAMARTGGRATGIRAVADFDVASIVRVLAPHTPPTTDFDRQQWAVVTDWAHALLESVRIDVERERGN